MGREEKEKAIDKNEQDREARLDTEISDQKLKRWLEERIVRLSLSRYELDSIQEQIDALDHHADYLHASGRAIPESERTQRETLTQDYHAKFEEMRKSFEPTASLPFTPSEEMKLYCQTLSEVNERIAKLAPKERFFEEKRNEFEDRYRKAEQQKHLPDHPGQFPAKER